MTDRYRIVMRMITGVHSGTWIGRSQVRCVDVEQRVVVLVLVLVPGFVLVCEYRMDMNHRDREHSDQE